MARYYLQGAEIDVAQSKLVSIQYVLPNERFLYLLDLLSLGCLPEEVDEREIMTHQRFGLSSTIRNQKQITATLTSCFGRRVSQWFCPVLCSIVIHWVTVLLEKHVVVKWAV
jgi:hypothetical protein